MERLADGESKGLLKRNRRNYDKPHFTGGILMNNLYHCCNFHRLMFISLSLCAELELTGSDELAVPWWVEHVPVQEVIENGKNGLLVDFLTPSN